MFKVQIINWNVKFMRIPSTFKPLWPAATGRQQSRWRQRQRQRQQQQQQQQLATNDRQLQHRVSSNFGSKMEQRRGKIRRQTGRQMRRVGFSKNKSQTNEPATCNAAAAAATTTVATHVQQIAEMKSRKNKNLKTNNWWPVAIVAFLAADWQQMATKISIWLTTQLCVRTLGLVPKM